MSLTPFPLTASRSDLFSPQTTEVLRAAYHDLSQRDPAGSLTEGFLAFEVFYRLKSLYPGRYMFAADGVSLEPSDDPETRDIQSRIALHWTTDRAIEQNLNVIGDDIDYNDFSNPEHLQWVLYWHPSFSVIVLDPEHFEEVENVDPDAKDLRIFAQVIYPAKCSAHQRRMAETSLEACLPDLWRRHQFYDSSVFSAPNLPKWPD